MKNISQLLKAAQNAQARMAELQEELGRITVEGQAGGGMVRVQLTARGELKAVSIDPSLLKPEEREILEDLIVAAHQNARAAAEERMKAEMARLASEMGLPPGMGLPF